MKSTLLLRIALLVMMLTSCVSGSEQAKAERKDPADMHPPSEAITGSKSRMNDSVIVPDSRPVGEVPAGSIDSVP